MTLKELGLSDEDVQDIIASLVASDANVNWTYDDTNGELTASLDNSVSVSTLEADILNNADVENAPVESVPKAQGDGTLSFGSIGHVVVEAEGPFSGGVGDPIEWSFVPSLNTGRRWFAAAEADGLIYAIGGNDGSNTIDSVEEYDPSTDTWTTVASLPAARSYIAGAEADGLIYAFGGDDAGGGRDNPDVYEYDPSTDTWTTVASLNTGRRQHSAAGADGLVYAIGGQESLSVISSVEEYDPSTDTWTTVASLNTAREVPAAAEVGGLIYAIGGDGAFTSTEQYDPSTNSWTEVVSNINSLNTARQEHAAAEAGGSIFAISGSDTDFNVISSVEKLTFENLPEDVYTASGDALVGVDDPNATLLNRATGRNANPNLARDGDTIAVASDKTARVFRTEEST